MAIGTPILARRAFAGKMIVGKAKWGVKRSCLGCGVKFYDLCRDPIVCPACGANFAPGDFTKSRRHKPPSPPAPPVEEAVKTNGLALDGGDDDADDDDALIDDPAELGEDDLIKVV